MLLHASDWHALVCVMHLYTHAYTHPTSPMHTHTHTHMHVVTYMYLPDYMASWSMKHAKFIGQCFQ